MNSLHLFDNATSLLALPPVAIDAVSLPSRGFFGIEPRVTHVSSPYDGAVVTSEGVVTPSLAPPLVRIPRFSFLGTLSPPDRVGQLSSPNIIFRPEGTKMVFMSLNDTVRTGPPLILPFSS